MIELPNWKRAYGPPPLRARLRAAPEDFVVDEEPLDPPDGAGEHVLLHIRKRNANSEWVARRIAQLAGVKTVDVGFAGLKDRAAVTSQWFSVNLSGRPEPDWKALEDDEIAVLALARHGRKLRRGELRGNRFVLRLTALEGDRAAADERLERIRRGGVPNYFGEQRFGRDGGNLARADAMFAGRRERDRHKRGLYLSAARSYLFNRVLQARIEAGCWDRAIPGDALLFDGSDAFRRVEAVDETTAQRVAAGRLHPSGPLWGRGRQPVDGEAAALERAALADLAAWRDALEHVGLGAERRSLRLPVHDLSWEWEGEAALLLRFFLEPGSYATGVVRELAQAPE